MGAVKVKEINLEYNMPTVQEAMKKLVNSILTAKGAGYKSVILIHAYGSSGVGGSIKTATKLKLKESSLSGIVRGVCAGECWMENKKKFLDVCPQLKDFSRHIDGNLGITVVLLK